MRELGFRIMDKHDCNSFGNGHITFISKASLVTPTPRVVGFTIEPSESVTDDFDLKFVISAMYEGQFREEITEKILSCSYIALTDIIFHEKFKESLRSAIGEVNSWRELDIWSPDNSTEKDKNPMFH